MQGRGANQQILERDLDALTLLLAVYSAGAERDLLG